MFKNHMSPKIKRCAISWLVGLTGVFGVGFLSPGWGQTSSVPSENHSDGAAVYFATETDQAPEIDFAEIERHHPLTLSQRLQITPEALQHLSQEHLDQLYARLTAGTLPDGSFEGMAFFSPSQREHLALLRQVLEKAAASPSQFSQRLQEHWIELWQGKVFDRRQKMLQNRVNMELIQDLLGEQFPQGLHKLPNSALLFPAKMYCGQSKLDSRRESVILDYAYNKDLPQYREEIDILVGRKGLNIRDELRMVHPGFYLGRVYVGKFFLINFVIMNAERTQDWKRQVRKWDLPASQMAFQEDCWTGMPYRQ